MQKILIAIATLLSLQVIQVATLSCLPCPPNPDCSKEPACIGNEKVYPPCGCCRVCAKLVGEECGGIWGFSGTCRSDLVCFRNTTSAQVGVCIETCNQALTAVSQPRRLTSPGYPGQYTNGLDCNYTITASVNQQVEITFNEFQTEPCCDYVEIFDGGVSLGRIKGSPSVPVSYTSTLNVLVVKFYTDSSVVRRGFNATYKQVTCGATETPTSEAQVFTSPDYPSNYPNNENCYWNFQTAPTQQVEVTFTAFNTESCCDFVEIIEDDQMTEKLKGTPTMPRTFTSVGQRLTVRFKSDGSVSRSGFSATYRIAGHCGTQLTATANNQYFTSPNYPGNYSNNQNCSWNIVPSISGYQVEVAIINLITELCCDYVEVYDGTTSLGRVKGTASNRIFMSSTGALRVRFYSDSSVVRQGFRAYYKLESCGFNSTATAYPQYITSPDFPSNYPNNVDCQWNLFGVGGKQVELSFTGGVTESCCDYVDIFDGGNKLARLNGNFPALSYISTTGALRVVFHTDSSVVRSGFNASYIQVGCSSTLTASYLPKYFTSTNYPQNYPNNENCSWTIGAGVGQQVELTILTLTTELCCDYVQVFDGDNSLARLKGSASNQVYASTSGQLRVVFFSDSSVTRSGFRASYKIETCGFNRTATASPQYIRSPNYPSNYPNNVDCEWNLYGGGNQVELSFTGGVTETCCDYVDIFDGTNKLARLKGNFASVSYISTTGALRVVFHTDSSVVRSGFNASFVQVGCGSLLTATNTSQFFSSTNYPQNYPNNENCSWTINAAVGKQVDLTIFTLVTEACCDYLEVFDGQTSVARLKGSTTNTPRYISTTGQFRVVFISDRSVTRSGFRAAFIETGCNNFLRASNVPQFLTSTNYPQNYPNNENCTWTIGAGVGQQVELTILTLSTELCCDYVEIFDGDNSIARLKGSASNQVYASTSGQLRVVFFSDRSITRSGFRASFVRIGCISSLTATDVPQFFTSTDYPQNYPNNENCTWTIGAEVGQQVELTVLTLTTETCCDYVQIFDGNNSLARLKGSASNQIYVSTSGQLRVVFISDSSVTRSGFRASFVGTGCGQSLTATNLPQYFTSTNYPQNYPNNENCSWTIGAGVGQQVELTIITLTTESCCDYVQVFDGNNSIARLKGSASNQVYSSTSGQLRVVFFSDRSITRSGFRASYKIESCGFNRTATVSPQYITSPDFPSNYPNNVDCEWNLFGVGGNQVELSFTGGVTETCCDYVDIFDGGNKLARLKGSFSAVSYISTTGALRVVFHTDSSVVRSGFNASYIQAGCGNSLTATNLPQYFTSTNYPLNYPNNENCSWTIGAGVGQQVELTIITLSTESCCDYVQVFDGNNSIARLKGSASNQIYSSTSGQLRVVFISDRSITRSGFRASYKIESCGFNRTATVRPQYITSPDFPSNYPNNVDCEWNLFGVGGKQVELSFTGGVTETCCDYVDIFDGTNKLARLKGSFAAVSYISTTGGLRVVFHTDSSVTRSGFNASFVEAGCSQSLTATNLPQIFNSTNYPQNYPNNENCSWTIGAGVGQQVELTIITLSTELCCDYVQVFDGNNSIARLKGSASNQVYASTSGQLRVVFISDRSITRSGFRASYKIESCGFNRTAALIPQYLTTPNYPSNYPNNVDCEWNLFGVGGKQVELSFTGGVTETCCDYADIFDGSNKLARLKGNFAAVSYISTTGALRVVFHTDSSVVRSGFNASFVQAPCASMLTTTNTLQYFTSTNYPQNYPNNENCSWTIDAAVGKQVELTFLTLTTEVCCDYVEVFDGQTSVARLKGSTTSTPQYVSSTGQFRVVFISDRSVTRSGFRASYIEAACGNTLTATNVPQFFTSTNYPQNYPNNENCTWTIGAGVGQQVELTIITLTTESCCDYVQVFDGNNSIAKLKGSASNQIYSSTSGQLRVVFFSDRSITRSGFRASYKIA